MDIRPVRTEADSEAAIARIAALWNAEPGSAEADELDVLATLVSVFEDEHYALPDLDPVETIQAHMDLSGHDQKALAEILGSRSRASEILNRRRALNLQQVHAIVEAWKIPAELLIKPYDLRRKAA